MKFHLTWSQLQRWFCTLTYYAFCEIILKCILPKFCLRPQCRNPWSKVTLLVISKRWPLYDGRPNEFFNIIILAIQGAYILWILEKRHKLCESWRGIKHGFLQKNVGSNVPLTWENLCSKLKKFSWKGGSGLAGPPSLDLPLIYKIVSMVHWSKS